MGLAKAKKVFDGLAYGHR